MAAETKTLARPEPAADDADPLSLYERDYHDWTLHQARAVREGRDSELDRENLAEEIEELGGSVYNAMESAFRVLLLHMLKWDHQPERISRSWAASIAIQRLHIDDIIAKNPSLRRRQAEAITTAYRRARLEAAAEMDRSERMLPTVCPYGLDDLTSRPFDWPDA